MSKTEIEIPETIQRELERIILPILKEEIELIGRGRGTIMGYSGAAQKVAIAAYRHLKSLPDQTKETGLRWVRASDRLPKEMNSVAARYNYHYTFMRVEKGVVTIGEESCKLDSPDLKEFLAMWRWLDEASSPADKPEGEPMTAADQLLQEILACTDGFKDASWEASIKNRINRYFRSQKIS